MACRCCLPWGISQHVHFLRSEGTASLGLACSAHAAAYTHAQADVWSAGVVLYYMLFSRHPFLDKGDDHNGAYPRTCQRILAGKYEPFPRGHQVSAAALDLVQKLLLCEPTRRLSIAGVMAHPWFAQDFPSKAQNWNEQYLSSAAKPPHTEAELRAIFNKAIGA